MSDTIYKKSQAQHYKGGQKEVFYKDEVDHCPYCKHSMSLTPQRLNYTLPIDEKYSKDNSLYAFYQCQRDACQKGFIAVFKYWHDGNKHPYNHNILQEILPSIPVHKDWPHQVVDLSTNFVEIYNQAVSAEGYGLNHACGPTYRKSLEFLIKDYIIKKNPTDEESIKSKFLSNCINDYIESENIKFCASRASWLGNDEVHYTRKWENKDIEDLKNLIQMAVNYIQDEMMMEHYKVDMKK